MVTVGRRKPRGIIEIRKIELNCLSRLKKQRAFNSSGKVGRKKQVDALLFHRGPEGSDQGALCVLLLHLQSRISGDQCKG